MRKLSRLHNSMEQALAAAHHVWEIMDEHAELPEKKDARDLQPLAQAIELKNVSFGYANEERSVLRDVSLQIPAGAMVALVGESGGGKSTLTKLLPRFHDPVSGGVFWDGVDLRDATISSLRGQIALVTQETVLFNDTVRHNIAYGKPEATQAEIEEAARVAFAHDFIMELPNGYETTRRRTRDFPVGRSAPAAGDRAFAFGRRASVDFGRSDFGARRGVGAVRATSDRQPRAQPHDDRHRPSPLNHSPRQHHRRDGKRPNY